MSFIETGQNFMPRRELYMWLWRKNQS